MGVVIAVLNGKGGVGKTTTTQYLGVALAERGYRVLLVDFDAQGGLTELSGIDPETVELTAADVILDDHPVKDLIIPAAQLPNPELGYDLLPSGLALNLLELRWLTSVDRAGGQVDYKAWWTGFRKVCNPVRDRYDLILVDNSPDLGQMALMAMAAADYLLIPLSAQRMSLRGLDNLMSLYKHLGTRYNNSLEIIGVLITMVNRTNRNWEALVRQIQKHCRHHRVPCFRHYIAYSPKVYEMEEGRTLLQDGLRGSATAARSIAEAYREVSAEISLELGRRIPKWQAL